MKKPDFKKEVEEIEEEILKKRKMLDTLLYLYGTENLPSFRKKPLDSNKQYKIYTIIVKKTRLQSELKIKTIAETSTEAISHLEELTGLGVEELFYISPQSVSKPMSVNKIMEVLNDQK